MFVVGGDCVYLKLKNNRKIEVIEFTGFWERLRGLKFSFDELDYVIKFPKKKLVSTIFHCQKIDIVMTGNDNKILYLYSNVKSEKYFLPKFKVRDMYFLPLGTAKEFKVGDALIFTKK